MAQFADPQIDTSAQRVILAAGSSTEPSLTWANDLTKGFWFNSLTNQIESVGFNGGGGGGATTELDNLGTTAINADLLPDADTTRSIGSSSLNWNTLYAFIIEGATGLSLRTTGDGDITLLPDGNGNTLVGSGINGSNLTVFGDLAPGVDGGSNIGTQALRWPNLIMSDAGSIFFSNGTDLNTRIAFSPTSVAFEFQSVNTATIDEDGIKTLDGSVAIPSYSFSNDISSGWLLDGVGVLTLAISGDRILQVTQTDVSFGVGNDVRAYFQDGTAADPIIQVGSNEGLFSPTGTGDLGISIIGAEVARFDNSAVAGETRLMLYDVDNGTLERVSVGTADSGGVGFKVLRIPN